MPGPRRLRHQGGKEAPLPGAAAQRARRAQLEARRRQHAERTRGEVPDPNPHDPEKRVTG